MFRRGELIISATPSQGVAHAGSIWNIYGDDSSVMGSCCGEGGGAYFAVID